MAASSLASYLKHYTIIGYVLDHEIGAAFLLHFSRGEMEFFLVPVTLKDGIHLSVSGFVYGKIVMI